MRGSSIVRAFFSRFFSFRPGRLTMAALALLMNPAVSAAAEKAAEKIAVLPTAPYYLYIAYESLAVFWVAILGLLVIIRMKLREIERIQALGVEEDPLEILYRQVEFLAFSKGNPPVEAKQGLAGVQADGPVEILYRQSIIAQFAIGNPPVVIGVHGIGCQLDDPVEGLDGLMIVADLPHEAPPVEPFLDAQHRISAC
jgi:hypothetical protein